ncbi:MAG: ester cyclase [Polyangiaceae bacterium]
MKSKIIAIAAILAATAVALVPTPARSHQGHQGHHGPHACSTKHRSNMEDFVDLYIDIYNSHDLSRFSEVMQPDAVNVTPFGPMTVAELAAAMQGFYAAFPDLTYQAERIFVDGDELIIEYSYTGTHLGELMGIPATGTVVHGRGLEVHTIEDGLIADTQNYSDVFGLLAQLGAL